MKVKEKIYNIFLLSAPIFYLLGLKIKNYIIYPTIESLPRSMLGIRYIPLLITGFVFCLYLTLAMFSRRYNTSRMHNFITKCYSVFFICVSVLILLDINISLSVKALRITGLNEYLIINSIFYPLLYISKKI